MLNSARLSGRSLRMICLLFLSTWIYLCQPRTAISADSSTVFRLVERFAPGPQRKVIPFFRSQGFEAGTGCTLEYSLVGNRVDYTWKILSDSAAIKSLFKSSPAFITTWWAEPALCSTSSKVTAARNAIQVAVAGPEQTAQSVTFEPEKIVLRQRSIESFATRFGSPFFRGNNERVKGNRSNNYAVGIFEKRLSLGEYSSIQLTLQARLVAATVNTGCVPGTPPAGAQNCYNARNMATHFRMAFGNIVWSDARCEKREAADPICKHQGRYMQASLQLFDERAAFRNDDFFVQRGNFSDTSRAIPIYRIDLRHLLPPGTSENPFRTVGKLARAEGDILPLLRRALLLAERLGHLPPRLVKEDGTKETDNEYVGHYSVGAINIGFEVTGLSDITFEIHDLTLAATKP